MGGTTYLIRKRATTDNFSGFNYAVSINIFGAEKEPTPNIAIDFQKEILIGFEKGDYIIKGAVVTAINGELSVNNYMGETISIIKKGNGSYNKRQ